MRVRDRMEFTSTLLTGMAVGAGLMYVFDEHSGGRRRARMRDKLVRAGHVLAREGRKQGRNLANQLAGSIAELRSNLRDRSRGIGDEVLIERVRAQLGHVVSHPGALNVTVEDGTVVVSGPVLSGEVDKICGRLSETRGVRDFRLDVIPHDESGSISSLQGDSRRQREERSA